MSTTQPLLPHALVTPLSTISTSAVPIGALAVIEWCIFDGHVFKDVVGMYNAAGYGKVNNKHGISYQLRRWGSVWYEEQGAVRPWELYTNIEKEDFKKQGLSGTDFKFVHPRDLVVIDGVVHVRGQPRGERDKRRETARRRSQARIETRSINTTPGSTISRLSLGHRAATSGLRHPRVAVRLNRSITDIPPPPIPESLKSAIKAKHNEWLDANKTGKTDMADAVEEELESLEKEAMEVSRPGFLAWKFGPEHISDGMN